MLIALAVLVGLVGLAVLVWPDPDPGSGSSWSIGAIAQDTRGTALHMWRAGLEWVGIRKKVDSKANDKKSAKGASAEESTVPASFKVLNSEGKPVSNAQIAASVKGSKTRTVKTDRLGAAGLKLVPGQYSLLVTHRDYAPLQRDGFTVPKSKKGASLTLRLSPGVTVTGRILDEDKKPLMGVVVSGQRRRLEQFAAGGDVYLDDAAYRDQLSDEKGDFRLEGVGNGDNLLSFRLAGYTPENRTFKLAPGKKPPVQNIVLKRPASISGRIVNEDMEPVGKASVEVTGFSPYGWNAEGLPLLKAKSTSNTSGSFTLGKLWNDGVYDVRVENAAYAPGFFTRIPADANDVTWVLERGGVFEGQAVWIDSPTSPALVNLRAEAIIQGTTYTRQLSSAHNGNFRFDRMPYGVYKLRVAQEGLASEPLINVRSVKDKPISGLKVEVYRTALLAGRVIDANTGSPIAGAKITVHATYGLGGSRKRNFTIESGANGRFQFRSLPAGLHTITGRAEGYLASQVANTDRDEITLLAGARVQDFVLRLSRGGAVEGYVRDASGSGVPDAEVQLFNASRLVGVVNPKNLISRTDGSGHFEIRGFPMPDHLQLYASANHPGFAKGRSTVIELTTELPNAATEITLTAGGTIRGQVSDPNGQPLVNTKVTFSSREFPNDPSESSFSTETTADGMFFLQHCTPGQARVAASRPGFVGQTKSVTVTDGKMLDRVNFRLIQGQQIAGVLADYSGRPVANARVRAIPLDRATGTDLDTTDKKGEFTLTGLSEGFFRLEANFTQDTAQGKQQYTFIHSQVQAGSMGVPFDCDLEAGASGKVVDEDGRGVNNFRMILNSRNDTDPPQDFQYSLSRIYKLQGLFQLEKIPRGLYKVEIQAEGFETYRSNDLEIGPHRTTRIPLIRLKRAAAIRGHAISATTDKPVNGAVIRVLDSALPESITVTRTELAAYPRQDIIEFLEIAYDDDYDLDPKGVLRPFARVRGNVTARSKTDFSGLFEIADIGSGRYVVEIEHPQYEAVRLENIVVSRDNVADLGDIHMQPGATVQGRVVDEEGMPISNALVRIPGERTGRNQARTDTAGNYLIRGVRAGRWPVTVRTSVRNRTVYAYQFAEVRQDQATRVDFVLELTAVAQGSVLAPDQSVRNGGTARLYPLDENGAPIGDIVYQGPIRARAFEISLIPPGQYLAVVTGSASGGPFTYLQFINLSRGITPLNFTLGGAQLAGTAVGGGEAPAGGVRMQLRPIWNAFPLPANIHNLLTRNVTTPANGRFNFRYLQAGLWYLYMGAGAEAMLIGEFNMGEGQRLTGLSIPTGGQ